MYAHTRICTNAYIFHRNFGTDLPCLFACVRACVNVYVCAYALACLYVRMYVHNNIQSSSQHIVVFRFTGLSGLFARRVLSDYSHFVRLVQVTVNALPIKSLSLILVATQLQRTRL